jgi:5'-nucleotidase/UDP-sugar diphosphatase
MLKGKCDFIVAVTHLDIGIDRELAKRFPEIKLIIGGHEHINSYDRVGNTIIAKADANVKSVYIHALNYDVHTKTLNVTSRLLTINDAIEEDKATKKVVDKWNARADSILRNNGFKPCEVLDSIADPLDGREASIRISQTNLGQLIAESMMEAITGHTDCAIFNSGSIRLDDVLTGYITQYDIFRTLPYDNKIVIRELQGTLIDSLLKTNASRERDGSFLQYAGVTKKDSTFYINGKSLDNDTTHYKVAMNYYLATGLQPKLELFKDLQPAPNTSPQLTIENNDMRNALMEKLKKSSHNKQLPAINRMVPCY